MNELNGFDDDTAEAIIKMYLKAQTVSYSKERVPIGKIPESQLELIKKHTGLDLSGYKRVFRFYEARHIYLEHGKNEHLRGQKDIEAEDLLLIPLIYSNPNTLILQKEKSREGNDTLMYTKKLGNLHIYVEEVIEEEKEIYVKTMIIKKATNLLGGFSDSNFDAHSPLLNVRNVRNQNANINKQDINTLKSSKDDIMDWNDLSSNKFDLLGLDGKYLKLIGEACKPTSLFIYGPGGSGKSTLTMKLSYYLAKKGNKVLYVAGEQFGTPVFIKFLNRLGIKPHSNLTIVRNLSALNIQNFDVVVLDSKDSLNIADVEFKEMQAKYPKQSFVILSQGTKSGNFTGSEKWRNLVDTMIYCENLVAYTSGDKNRWGGKGSMKVDAQ